MLKLLDRYIARQFVGIFLGLVLGLPLLFIIGDITDNLDTYLEEGIALANVARSYLFQVPQYVVWSFPIAALVATVFTISNLTRHREIVAAKAGGISFYRLIRPILLTAALLSAVALGLSELVPFTNRRAAELQGKHTARGFSLRTNFVFQSAHGDVLSARRLDPTANEMSEVVVERKGGPRGLGLFQTAERAEWKPGRGWTLGQGYLRVLTPEGAERTFTFSAARLTALRETPTELLAEPKAAEEMRYAEMTRAIAAIERSGGDAAEIRVEREQKAALALAVLVIVLFGAPLATSSRRGGTAYGIGISLAITMIYLLLFRVGQAVGGSGALDPVLAAWMPNALFFVAGLLLLWRVRT